MCGIIGIINADKKKCVNQALVDALTILQHRGQDAAGIVTIDNHRFNLRKSTGTVADVFQQDHIERLLGGVGIGHVRYPTAGGGCTAEAQPLYTNCPFGIALAHNGNITNTTELISDVKEQHRHINTNSDSELLLNIFAEELHRKRLQNISVDDVFDTCRSIMRRCKGGYAVVMLINHVGLLAFRDPNGIRPLCFGKRIAVKGDGDYDYAVASESVAIDAVDPQFVLERDVQPGEAIFVDFQGNFFCEKLIPNSLSIPFTPCMFEYVYFARPDSLIDGVSVYEARRKMGSKLAEKIKRIMPKNDIDVVIPVPETSRTAALETANQLERPYREGFVKNRYIARTFIMPGQELRRKTVRLKLNTIRSEFKDKNVLLVDDSIVRGTTSMELVQLARDAGAKKVYFASAAPPVRFSNVYGIDIPTRLELVAHGRTEDEISEKLHCDGVIYNDLEAIEDAVRSCNPTVLKDFEVSCFNGVYVTEDVTSEYLLQLEDSRGKSRQGAVTLASPSISTSTNGAISPVPNRSKNPRNLHSPKTINGLSSAASSSSSDTSSIEYNDINTGSNEKISSKQRTSSCEALYNDRSLFESSAEKKLRVK